MPLLLKQTCRSYGALKLDRIF